MYMFITFMYDGLSYERLNVSFSSSNRGTIYFPNTTVHRLMYDDPLRLNDEKWDK